jgi:hypothetical protein
VIDPECGTTRQARVIAMCRDNHNRNWVAVAYFWSYKAAISLGYSPKHSEIDVGMELLEDTVVQYVDINCLYDDCFVVACNSKAQFHERCKDDKRIIHHLHARRKIYCSRERFNSRTLQHVPHSLLVKADNVLS